MKARSLSIPLAAALTLGLGGAFTVPLKPMIESSTPRVQVKRKWKFAGGLASRASLNRSRHWPSAAGYQDARRKSPFPDRPVR